jgi:nucleoside-diphosphate-sugar epimerase
MADKKIVSIHYTELIKVFEHDGFIGSHLVEGLLDKGCQVRESGDMTRIRQNSVSCPQIRRSRMRSYC